MWRERTLVGLLFTAAIYPTIMILWQREQPKYETAMGLSLYVTLGIMLLAAVQNPAPHRSLITFAASSSFAHATVMAVMVFRDVRSQDEWPAPVILTLIGAALLALAPTKQRIEQASTAGA